MASAEVDVPYICASYAVAEPTLQTLLDAPTADLVQSFLQQLDAKAREHDELKAEKLRQDVELENAVRSGDSRAHALKSSVDKSLKEVEDVRRKLNDEENSRATLESELQSLKTSSTSSTSEVAALHARIATLEASNRDAFALVESKSTAHDRVAEELSTQHQKILGLRRELSELETKNQGLENAASSNKFHEQALQQEIELLKKSNDWYEGELNTRNIEFSKHRKEKGARISELQRLNEDANQTIDSARRTETTLRNRVEEVSQKAEDAFSRIQQQQEAAAKAEESFHVQLDCVQRLADLQKQSADTARNRLKDVEASLDQIKEHAAEEIGQIQAEVETERGEKEDAERRVAELELQIERLEADASTRHAHSSVPGTPREGMNGGSTPRGFGSPTTFSPGASRMKGGLSFTQLYSQHAEMKAALDAERRRNEKLTVTIDDMIQDLETKQPEVEELRMNHDRLQADVAELSSLLEEASQDRDATRKEARQLGGRVDGLTRERELHRQELRDLSAQVTVLVVEVQARAEGIEPLHGGEWAEMVKIAKNGFDERTLEGMSETAQFITKRLSTFKTVSELQEQNEKLLRITRELGEKMEGEDAKREQHQKDLEELDALRERVERHRDEMKAMITQSQSYIRERDMFRRMLAHRGQIPAGSDLTSLFGQSVDGRATPATPTGVPPGQTDQSPSAKDVADYVKLLKELQTHFDQYRNESAADHTALKQQVDRLAKDKGELQGENARVGSQLTLAHERYELLRSSLSMLQSEHAELQKRSSSLSEAAAKQDLRTQQVAEELVEARTLAESMRTETANLKAGKELWRNTEARLTEDNRALMDERSRLNKMVSDLQNLQNERELSDSETRRRLQTRAESLETDLQTVRRKLDDEVEESKKAALRREYDQDQTRKRIDDLVKSLGNIREELATAKNQRDQSQARVEELKIELRNAEEKAQALQPVRTSRSAPASADEAAAENAETLSREQELGVEVADLKRDLELARSELETAKSHVQQYKAISQSSEEELQNLNETSDQFRDEMERAIGEKDTKIRDLEQRVEDISTELSTTNTELSELRTQHEESNSRFNDQKSIFDAEVSRLNDESERHAENAKLHQQDVRAQAEIAQQAQQSYENELVKHADAAQNLQKVRAEYNTLRTEVAEIKADAQAARTTLAQNEESWSETRNRYESELTELRTRREDVDAQNRLLHQQLENVSAQISALKQQRGSTDEEGEETTSGSSGVENLQEVIRYLRREKEIVDVQYELSIQDGRRLKQQLDHTQSQLDQTREKLNQERQTAADEEQSASRHSKLMQTINELNLFRESSVTLRNEARQAQAQLADKVKEVDDLMGQIQPLTAKVREVESELETKEGEMKLLQEDRDRWQQRTQNILQKYDRVDPAEMEALNNQISTLQGERDQLTAEVQPLREQVEGIPEQIRVALEQTNQEWQGRRERMAEQFKSRSKALSTQIREKEAEKEQLVHEKQDLSQQLESVKAELENTKAELQSARDDAASSSKPTDTVMSNAMEEGQVEDEAPSTATDVAALEERAKTAETKASEEAERANNLQNEVDSLQTRIKELEGSINEHQQRFDAANAELSQFGNTINDLQQRFDAANAELAQLGNSGDQRPDSDGQQTLEKLKNDLTAAQQEVESLRANAAITSSTANIVEDGVTPIAEQVAQQVSSIRGELEASHNARVQEAEEQFKKRADSMKSQLSKKLMESKENLGKQIRAENETALQQLRTEHGAEIQRLKSAHAEELELVRNAAQTTIQTADGAQQPSGDAGAEGTKATAKWNPTDAEVRELLSTNTTIKAIVSSNVRNKLSQETSKIKAEHEKQLAERLDEAKTKADKDVENARLMESKRSSVKLSMAESKARNATAKIEVVERAAKDTPQRPVGDVWALAKDTKAAVPTPSQSAQQVPAPATQQPQQFQPAGVSSFGQPSHTLQTQPAASGGAQPPGQLPPKPAAASQLPQGPPAQLQQPDQVQQAQQASTAPQLGSPTQPQSPVDGARTQALHSRPPTGQAGTGPGALRSILGAGQSGLPRPGGGGAGQAGRGGQPPSNLPRGGGRGRGRGAQNAQGGQNQNGQGNAGGGGGGRGINPSAKQFVPGNKRPREDAQEGGEGGNAGKRPRGGGGGGGG